MRDRLQEFNEEVSRITTSTGTPAAAIQIRDPAENKSALFVKDFLIKVEKIQKIFFEIDQMIQDATGLQTTLLEVSGTDERLFTLYENIRKSFMKIADKITGLEKSFDVGHFSGSNTELRICCTQVLTLKQKLTSSVSNYYNIQEEYKTQCKARVKRQAEISGANVSVTDFNEAIENKTEFFVQAIFPDYNVTRYYLKQIKERHADFLRLEKSILQLRDLIFDVHMILIEDAALVNRIDKHIYAVLDYVMDATEYTEEYKHSQKAARIKYYFCFCCIGIILFTIFIAVLSSYL